VANPISGDTRYVASPTARSPGRQGQWPPLGIDCATVSVEHSRSHVALVQLTEQEPVQMT